jgi:hypothetical protein
MAAAFIVTNLQLFNPEHVSIARMIASIVSRPSGCMGRSFIDPAVPNPALHADHEFDVLLQESTAVHLRFSPSTATRCPHQHATMLIRSVAALVSDMT